MLLRALRSFDSFVPLSGWFVMCPTPHVARALVPIFFTAVCIESALPSALPCYSGAPLHALAHASRIRASQQAHAARPLCSGKKNCTAEKNLWSYFFWCVTYSINCWRNTHARVSGYESKTLGTDGVADATTHVYCTAVQLYYLRSVEHCQSAWRGHKYR